jgi:hypothetical protein
MKKFIKNTKKTLIISLITSIIIIIASQYKNLWSVVFGDIAMIPYQWPAFSDFGSLTNALKSLKEGYDPYFYNPYDTHKVPYVYTKIWLIIFNFLNLNNPILFLIVCFLIITVYFSILLNFLKYFKNKYSYIALLFFFISPSNTLLIERLNTDMIIFILTYFLAINKNFIIKNILFIFSISLKVYPIFSFLIFLKNKKFYYTILLIVILIYAIYDQIIAGNKNMIEYSLIFAYGARTFANALYRVLGNYNFVLDGKDYELLKILLILTFTIFAIFLFLQGVKNKKNYSEKISNFFIVGSSIYLGTFIFTSNIDYRLIFLIYTFPILFNDLNKWHVKLFFISCFVSFYSLWFHNDDYKSVTFAAKGLFIYILKFYIFLYLSYYLGSVLSSNKIINRIIYYLTFVSKVLKVFQSKKK